MQYKLIKALPTNIVGDIVEFYDGDCTKIKPGQILPNVGWYWVKNGEIDYKSPCPFNADCLPEWFEKVKEWPKSWEELPKKAFNNAHWVTNLSRIEFRNHTGNALGATKNEVPNFAYAKSILAYSQLSMLANEMNGDWIPDWNDRTDLKYYVNAAGSNMKAVETTLGIDVVVYARQLIVFKTREMAQFSLKHHAQLWKEFYMI